VALVLVLLEVGPLIFDILLPCLVEVVQLGVFVGVERDAVGLEDPARVFVDTVDVEVVAEDQAGLSHLDFEGAEQHVFGGLELHGFELLALDDAAVVLLLLDDLLLVVVQLLNDRENSLAALLPVALEDFLAGLALEDKHLVLIVGGQFHDGFNDLFFVRLHLLARDLFVGHVLIA